ncbi:hypothetical protein C5749_00370 [Sphingobacterium gobiense]|uniref:DUF4142 domain-containing protein n=1 Tax=Sphingobacterium gobiense TaxID=1382456 RepID=A0A2S9JRN0_9SPHI|nr:hypothetical protein C5749_00370 [Sphingobacterium gobiense]
MCAGTLFASCDPHVAKERQLSLTHTTLVDNDAYQFFQLVGSKVVYENDYAAYAGGVARSSQAKQLAAKAQEVYGFLVPQLDSLARLKQVDFPIKGAARYAVAVEAQTAVEREKVAGNRVDSDELDEDELTTEHVASVSYSDDAYIHHVQHETAIMKDQLQRMTRNTDKEVRAFAEENQGKVAELFALAGGKEDANAHH